MFTSNGTASMVKQGQTIYVGNWAGKFNFGGLFSSSDDGVNWTDRGFRQMVVKGLAVVGDTLFIGTSGGSGTGAYFSTDDGQTWTRMQNGLTISQVRGLLVGEGVLFAWGDNGSVTQITLFRSPDNGKSWTATTQMNGIGDIAVTDGMLFVGTTGNGIFFSTDAGVTWKPANTGLTNKNVGTLKVWGDNLFAGTGGGVFRSSDKGASWTEVGNASLVGECIVSVSGAFLFASSRTGVWRRPLGDFLSTSVRGSVAGTTTLPGHFFLEKNYPNPFNPSTTISYDVPETGFVSLKVFDVLGREASELVNDVKSPGRYSTVFNAAGLPSGMYIYRLASGSFTESKKMMIVK